MKQILFISMFLTAGVSVTFAQNSTHEQGKLSNLLTERNPDVVFQYKYTKKMHSGEFLAHFFTYRSNQKNKQGGSGFEITARNESVPHWYIMTPGDFGPHSLHMVDLNIDDKPDLFFYTGSEDVFSTHIFLANYTDAEMSGYARDHFKPVYSNHNDYSILIDPDKDGHPEILDSGYSGKTNRSGFGCTGNPSGIIIDKNNRITLSDSVRSEIVSKYFEITNGLDDYNFDYSMPDVYPVFNTFILSPVKIVRIEGNRAVDVTSSFPEYLHWRIGILRQIKQESPETCRDRIDSVITYHQGRLNE